MDIDVKNAVEAGFKYFISVVHNFESRPMSSMKDCVCGTMEVENSTSNPNWVPSTISNCIIPQSKSSYVLVGAYDLETREYIHLDLDWEVFERACNVSNAGGLFKSLLPYVEAPKISVYDLMLWHVSARGRLVSKENAVTHFLYEDFSSGYTKTLEYLGV